jgi:hypothetical protein
MQQPEQLRKTDTITFGAEAGRDAGKVYVITEMSATQAEKWALRALLALGHAGFVIPPDLAAAGMAAMAVVGINSLLQVSWIEAEPLLDEMLGCVKIKPSEQAEVRPLVETDIQEVSTRVRLRKAVWDLHVDFSSAAALLTSLSATATTFPGASTIPTSPAPSE